MNLGKVVFYLAYAAGVSLASISCPEGFIALNSICVQKATTCPTNFILLNGLCHPFDAGTCPMGYLFINEQCCSLSCIASCQSQPETCSCCQGLTVQSIISSPITRNPIPTDPCSNQPVTPFPIQTQSPCSNEPVTPFPIQKPVPCPNQPVTPYPVQTPTPCPNQPVTPFPLTTISPCPNQPIEPITTAPIEEVTPCPVQPAEPCPPCPIELTTSEAIIVDSTTTTPPLMIESITNTPSTTERLITTTDLPTTTPATTESPTSTTLPPNLTLPPPLENQNTTTSTTPSPSTTLSTSTSTQTSTTTSFPFPTTSTSTTTPLPTTTLLPTTSTSTTIPPPISTTTSASSPITTVSPPVATLPPAQLVKCPAGTILMNNVCRLLHCPNGQIMLNNRCIQPICPDGTVWSGIQCARKKPNEYPLITFKNTINTKINAQEPEVVINNKNSMIANATVEIPSQNYGLNCDDNETDIDTECDIVPTAGKATPTDKCCIVVTPRMCQRSITTHTGKWRCYSRRYKRCGDFCIAPVIFLRASKLRESKNNFIVIPPNAEMADCSQVGDCQESAGSYDCSGCAAKRAVNCSPYCYRYNPCTNLGGCSYYDQIDFCRQNRGREGCRPMDGCLDDWCDIDSEF